MTSVVVSSLLSLGLLSWLQDAPPVPAPAPVAAAAQPVAPTLAEPVAPAKPGVVPAKSFEQKVPPVSEPTEKPKIVGPIRALDSITQDPALLGRWHTRHYRLFLDTPMKWAKKGVIYIETKRKLAATIPLSTELQADRTTLRDAWWELNGEHKPLSVELRYAPDNLLSPQRIVVDPLHKPTASELRRGNFDLKVDGYRITGEWPVGTLSKPALLRIVGMLPREPGAAFSFPYFTEVPNLEIMKNDHPIVCVGPELIRLQYKTVLCTKFQWNDVSLWVRNTDGILAKLERPGYVALELSELAGCVIDPRPLPQKKPGPTDPGSPEVPPDAPAPPAELKPMFKPIVPPPAADPFKS